MSDDGRGLRAADLRPDLQPVPSEGAGPELQPPGRRSGGSHLCFEAPSTRQTGHTQTLPNGTRVFDSWSEETCPERRSGPKHGKRVSLPVQQKHKDHHDKHGQELLGSPGPLRDLGAGPRRDRSDGLLLLGGGVEQGGSHRGHVQDQRRRRLLRVEQVLLELVLLPRRLLCSAQRQRGRPVSPRRLLQQGGSLPGLAGGQSVLLRRLVRGASSPLHILLQVHQLPVPRVWLLGGAGGRRVPLRPLGLKEPVA